MSLNSISRRSLAGLLLLEAAKKTDHEFRVPPHSRQHTVHDARDDINKMTFHLLDKSLAAEVEGRNTPTFIHPTQKG